MVSTDGRLAGLHRPDGQLLRRSAFGNLWRRSAREAGVEEYTFHSLRRYYASLLVRRGES